MPPVRGRTRWRQLAQARPIAWCPSGARRSCSSRRPGRAIETWPTVIDADEQFYFRPDAGKIMASPADETPMPPCDVQPEEIDIAILVDRLERAIDMPIPRIEHRWAGLRSFVRDKTPVVGYDDGVEDFSGWRARVATASRQPLASRD